MPVSLNLLNNNNWRFRLLRHSLFWALYLVLYSLLDLNNYKEPFAGFSIALRWAPYTMLNTYVTLYWLVDRYLLRSRFLAFFCLLGLWTLVTIPLAFLSHLYLLYPYCWPEGPRPGIRQAMPEFFEFYPMLVCEVITGFAVFLRLHKFWRAEMLEKLQLKKETEEAELQLLKAQLHPHFLFNTLNNLYTLILKKSDRAPVMLKQLAAILDHVMHQDHSSEVPLQEEIKFCQDYIELEKERYGSRLAIRSNLLTCDSGKLTVLPMLFQPLIENAFKHGASEQVGEVWIDIRLVVEENWLVFEVANSASIRAGAAATDGIGIANIKRRLQLLYPERYRFERNQTATEHTVRLAIELSARSALRIRENEPVRNEMPAAGQSKSGKRVATDLL